MNYLTSDCTEDAVSQSSPLLAGNVKYSGTNQFYAGTPANWSICTGHLYWVDLFLHALLPCLGPSSWSAAVQQRDGSTFVASVGWIAVSILGLPCVQWSLNIYTLSHTQPSVKLFIDGKFVESNTNEWINNYNPVSCIKYIILKSNSTHQEHIRGGY